MNKQTIQNIEAPDPAKSTKAAQLIELLRCKPSCTLSQISNKLGWQPHTTRAAISRLRKAGIEIETVKGTDSGGTTYEIVCSAPTTVTEASS